MLSISKAIPTGGMWPFIPVAITKFTDQSKVAHNANNTFFLVIHISKF
jgi:hypothetical protein